MVGALEPRARLAVGPYSLAKLGNAGIDVARGGDGRAMHDVAAGDHHGVALLVGDS